MVNQGWELLELSDAEQAAAEHTRRWPCMRPQSQRIRLPALTHAVTGFSTCGYRLQHIRLQAPAHAVTGSSTYGYRLRLRRRWLYAATGCASTRRAPYTSSRASTSSTRTTRRDARPRARDTRLRRAPATRTKALLSADVRAAASAQARPVEEKSTRPEPSLEVTTGTSASNGLTISTGHEIEQSRDVKEVKPSCCTLL